MPSDRFRWENAFVAQITSGPSPVPLKLAVALARSMYDPREDPVAAAHAWLARRSEPPKPKRAPK